MNGLRTYHRTLWKKRSEIGASMEETPPSWQYYDQLMFLNDHFQARETTSSMSKRKLNIEGNTNINNNDDDYSGDTAETESEHNSISNAEKIIKSRKLWKPCHENILKNVHCSSTACYKEKNPEMLFGKLVGHSLRSIKDERNREYAKLQIQQVLFKCRYPETQVSQHGQSISPTD